MKMMKFLNKMDIPMLEYVFGTGKCIKILIDSKNHDFDEKTLEAQLTLQINVEAQKQLVEAWDLASSVASFCSLAMEVQYSSGSMSPVSRNLPLSLARSDMLVSGAGLIIGRAVSGVNRLKCVIGSPNASSTIGPASSSSYSVLVSRVLPLASNVAMLMCVGEPPYACSRIDQAWPTEATSLG